MTAINNDLLKKWIGASKIAQWVKVLVGKPDDPSGSGTHVTGGKKTHENSSASTAFHGVRTPPPQTNRQTRKQGNVMFKKWTHEDLWHVLIWILLGYLRIFEGRASRGRGRQGWPYSPAQKLCWAGVVWWSTYLTNWILGLILNTAVIILWFLLSFPFNLLSY